MRNVFSRNLISVYKIVLNLIGNYKYYLIFVLPALLLVGVGTLSINWSMVDDGKSAQISSFLTNATMDGNFESFGSSLLEPESGRFRPFYWIYLWLKFILLGSSSFSHHLVHLFVFILSTFLIFEISRLLFNNKLVGTIASLLFAVDSLSIENWYRLGPQEPMVVVLLSLSILFYIYFWKFGKSSNLIFSSFLVVCAFLFKETVVAYLGILLVVVLLNMIYRQKKHNKTHLMLYFLITSGVVLVIRYFVSKLYPSSGYAALYILDGSIATNLRLFTNMLQKAYDPILSLLMFTFSVRFAYSVIIDGVSNSIKRYYWNIIFLGWFVIFILIQLPWSFAFGRYLQVSLLGLFIFLSLEFVELIHNINLFLKENAKKIKRLDLFVLLNLTKIGLYFLLAVVVFYHILTDLNYMIWVKGVSDFDGSMMQKIKQNVNEEKSIVLNADYSEGPLEIYHGIDWHLRYIHNIQNFEYGYISSEYLPSDEQVVLMHGEKPIINELDLISKFNLRKTDSLKTTIDTFNFAPPAKILKMLPIKLVDLSIESNANSNLYNKSSYSYEWKIYEK